MLPPAGAPPPSALTVAVRDRGVIAAGRPASPDGDRSQLKPKQGHAGGGGLGGGGGRMGGGGGGGRMGGGGRPGDGGGRRQ